MKQVSVPESLQKELKDAMKTAGIAVPDSEQRWELALGALKVHPYPYPCPLSYPIIS